MIISASYKTDIPAFYGEWFRNRLKAGFCRMANPFSRSQRYTISLRQEDVDGFVFWTKNVAPFMRVLDEIHELRIPFIVQYTITGYPRVLESRVVDAAKSVQSFRSIAEKFGNRVAIWRYDPIILSTGTDTEFHRNNFAHWAAQLSSATDEVIVSFMQLYKKTRRNMDEAASLHRFDWKDPPAEKKRELLRDLVAIATDHNMNLKICTQPHLMVQGVGEARCIDAQRLMDVSDSCFRSRLKGLRTGCRCFESKDIGDYDTCPHGCVYCYAVRRRSVALRRYQVHDPQGEYLFPHEAVPPSAKPPELHRSNALPLFQDREEGQHD